MAMGMLRRRTKIVCTIGPACDSEERLEQLLWSGLDVARLNFSHGTHEEHLARIQALRSVSTRLGKPIALLQDLCGPKIRTGRVPGGTLPLETNSEIILVEGREARIHKMPPSADRWKLRSLTYPGIAAAMADQWGAA